MLFGARIVVSSFQLTALPYRSSLVCLIPFLRHIVPSTGPSTQVLALLLSQVTFTQRLPKELIALSKSFIGGQLLKRHVASSSGAISDKSTEPNRSHFRSRLRRCHKKAARRSIELLPVVGAPIRAVFPAFTELASGRGSGSSCMSRTFWRVLGSSRE